MPDKIPVRSNAVLNLPNHQ